MKILMSSGDMRSAVQEVSKVIVLKNLMPIMYNVRIVAQEDGEVVFSACNEEMAMTVRRRAVTVDEPGVACVNCKQLLGALKELPEQPIAVMTTKASALFDYTNGHFEFSTADATEWPKENPVDESCAHRVILAADVAVAALTRISSIVAPNDLRPVIGGVLFAVADGQINIVGTNSYTLAVATIKEESAIGEWSVIIPQKAVDAIIGARLGCSEILTFATDAQRLHVVCGDCGELNCRLIVGRYPNWRSVIPKEFAHDARFAMPDLVAALKRAKVIASSRSDKLVKMDIRCGEIVVSTQNLDFHTSATETITCSTDGPCAIGYNADHLADALSLSEGADDGLIIRYNSPSQAAMIIPATQPESLSVLALVMPVALA